MIDKYGVDSFSKTNEFIEKQKISCLKKYGVENASQCPYIFQKQQKNRYEIHQFRNTNIYYQGSYEKDFLEKYYDNMIISKIDPINYYYNGHKVYFPDFYLPDINLIVEIKSKYTYNKYVDKNQAKQKKCLDMGYNYIFIIDKNYDIFEMILR